MSQKNWMSSYQTCIIQVGLFKSVPETLRAFLHKTKARAKAKKIKVIANQIKE